MLNSRCPSESIHGKKGSIVYDCRLFPLTIHSVAYSLLMLRGDNAFTQISDLVLSLSFRSQELEAALHRDDSEFISDLIACLLQGCYQRRDIT